MHYYPFNLKDYLTETAHLPPMADLAYRRLLDLYYKTEEPIPNKPKWVANRIRLDSEEPIIGFVLREYFKLDGVGVTAVWRHKTCDEVIAKYQKKAAVARANGVLHVAGTERKPKSDADRSLTKNQKPRTKKSPLPPEGEAWWEEFWTLYPRRVAKPVALKAFAAALTRAPSFEVIMVGLRRQLPCEQWADQTKIPHPATWLNRDGWNDEVAVPPAAGGGPSHWWASRSGIERKGMEFGLPPPPPAEDDMGGAQFARFQATVWLKAGDGEWIDPQATRVYAIFKQMQNGNG